MIITYKCNNKVVRNKATQEIRTNKHYDEHADMHYEGGGWSTYSYNIYNVDKCKECGKYHRFVQEDLISIICK